jgi:nucleoside 2-deoxyribosyltransferase
MKVYVAGPMSGHPDLNFPAFEQATRELREAGFSVTSPHERDEASGFDPTKEGAQFALRLALQRDVEAVLEADGVALLDGWEESPSAVIESLTAQSKGAPVLPIAEFLKRFAAFACVLLALVFASMVTVNATAGRQASAVTPEDHIGDVVEGYLETITGTP